MWLLSVPYKPLLFDVIYVQGDDVFTFRIFTFTIP